MSLALEPATQADLPGIVQLMNEAFRGTGSNAGWNSEAAFIQGNRTTEALLRSELSAKPCAHLLILRGNTSTPLQGCVWLEPKTSDLWYLGSLTVLPALQSTGIGGALLAAAEQWAADHGARTITMNVVNIRDTLIAWYQRRGYHLTGETHPFPYGDTRFGTPLRPDLTFLTLQKILSPSTTTH